MKWFGESVTKIEAVFSVWSVPKAYRRSEFSVVNSVVRCRSELKPGVQESTGGQLVKILSVN
jgi:hypothetical protein